MKGILYYTEDYIKGKLIETDGIVSTHVHETKYVNLPKLRDILLDGISDNGHRCISVYRHAFILHGDVYNVCLSCGDFYKNDEFFYLTKSAVEKFKKETEL